jgi:hypothetical protein
MAFACEFVFCQRAKVTITGWNYFSVVADGLQTTETYPFNVQRLFVFVNRKITELIQGLQDEVVIGLFFLYRSPGELQSDSSFPKQNAFPRNCSKTGISSSFLDPQGSTSSAQTVDSK